MSEDSEEEGAGVDEGTDIDEEGVHHDIEGETMEGDEDAADEDEEVELEMDEFGYSGLDQEEDKTDDEASEDAE